MEDQDQHLREKKQFFLRDEILDGGHDPETFQAYLNSLRPEGGSNVDVWDMKELTEVVDCFKEGVEPIYNEETQRYLKPVSGKSHASHDLHSDELKAVVGSQKSEEELPHLEEHVPHRTNSHSDYVEIKSEDDRYHKVVHCHTLPTTELSAQENAEIFITDPELIRGSLFSASYIVYRITTKPMEWIVKRRFSDFFWLRSHLTKMYPYIIIPPVPRKKTKGKFENDFIARRMALLEKFMNSCLQSDEVKADPYLQAFLQVEDESKWKIKKKEADALKRSTKIADAHKSNGQAVLQIAPELKDFAQAAASMVYQSEPIYKKMRKLSKQLIMDFDQVSNTIFTLGECFASLYNTSNTFNKHSPLGQNSTMDDIYLTLNNMMVSWGEQMLGQIKIVQHGLNNYFKFSHFELESIKDILKQRNTMASDFTKFKKMLDLKKEKAFQLGDVSRWEIPISQLKEINQAELLKNKEFAYAHMFPKETATELELRDQFAYYNFETYNEMNAANNKKCKAYMKNFQQFAKDQSENLSEVHVHWADVLAHFSDAKLNMGKNTVLMNKDDALKSSGQKKHISLDTNVLREDA